MSCVSCLKSKASLTCIVCSSSVCKSCAQFIDDETFAFMAAPPVAIGTYCPTCFDQVAASEVAAYDATMVAARDINVYFKTQGKESRLIKRIEAPVKVNDCADYQETVLRLAFFAARAKYNGLVDVDITSEKVRDGAYQTTKWSGTGIPANIQARHQVSDRSIWQNPN